MYDENTSHLMALANHLMNVKDSRWLQLEVCREFQRGQCSRTEMECKFAHPPPHVEVQNGRVTACYDSIKGRCTRENPKCKYLHPPQHLKDQLLINGRNNLALKNLLMNQLSTPVAAPMGVSPLAVQGASALVPGVATAYSPYAAYALNTAACYPGLVTSPEALGAVGGVLPAGTAASPASMAAAMQAVHSQQKVVTSRSDRVEVCREYVRGSCQRSESECKFAHPQPTVERATDGTVTICVDFVRNNGACTHSPCRYFHPPAHLLPSNVKSNLHRNGATACLSSSQETACHSPPNPNAMPRTAMPIASAASLAAAHAAAAVNASQYAAAVAQATAAATSVAGKKRPLEPDTSPTSPESILLAAAALNTPVNKRAALEKSGMPMYQPVTHMATMGSALHYPHLAAYPGLQTSYVPTMAFTATALSPNNGRSMQVAAAAAAAAAANNQMAALSNGYIPTNASSVAYFDESGQLLDTLPVCRDFKQGRCDRPNCRYVHLLEEYVEVNDGKVTVCRDFAKGKCTRVMCKYYHVPILPGSLLLNRLMSPTTAAIQSVTAMTPTLAQQQQQQQQFATAPRLTNTATDFSSAFGAYPFSAFGFPQLTGSAAVVDHTAFILAQQQQQQAAAMYIASVQQQTASIGNGGS